MNQVRKNIKLGSGLVFEKDEEWKRVRRIVSPTFSGKKLKQVNLVTVVKQLFIYLCMVDDVTG